MPAGVTRILPFAVISAVLHAAVLMNAPERLEIAVTPGGDTGPVAVRLVPSGTTPPDPAAQSGVAGSVPEPVRDRSRRSRPQATRRVDEATPDESSKPSVQEAVGPDHVQASLAERSTGEAAPKSSGQKRANTGATRESEQRYQSRSTPDADEKPVKATADTETGTNDAPDTPQASDASETVARSDKSKPTEEDAAGATDAGTRHAQATNQTASADRGEAPERDQEVDTQSGAESANDRARIATRARQQVEIHFRDRFRYPRIARQRGWEGRVVLTFRLQPDGRITDVEVAESSGRSILDENARQTLIHIQRVPEIADRLRGEPLELEVPVTYRLQPA